MQDNKGDVQYQAKKVEKLKEGSGIQLFTNSEKFIKYSFKKNFSMNEHLIELYKPPKILGDVFEAIIGALFLDGGIETVVDVLKPLMAPFVLFVAKYSKNIFKEPKEDFLQVAIQLNMRPNVKDNFERVTVPVSVAMGQQVDDDQEDELFRLDVKYDGETMVSGYGHTLA